MFRRHKPQRTAGKQLFFSLMTLFRTTARAAAGKKRATADFAAIFRSQNFASARFKRAFLPAARPAFLLPVRHVSKCKIPGCYE
jgi:hypothetical protein